MSTLTEYTELEQGTEEWLTARRGIVTASVVGRLITTETPETIEYHCGECDAAANEPCVSLRNAARAAAQRIRLQLRPTPLLRTIVRQHRQRSSKEGVMKKAGTA